VRRRVETALETARVGPTTVGAAHRTAGQAVQAQTVQAGQQAGYEAGHTAGHRRVAAAVDPGRTDRAIAATVARTWHPPAPAPAPVRRRPSRLADRVLLAGTVVFAVLLLAGGVALFLLVT
jgi:hypothetical protein